MRLSQAVQHARARGGHPGFKAVAARIGAQPGIRSGGAVLEAARQKARPSAIAANPRLQRVPTPGSHRTKAGVYR